MNDEYPREPRTRSIEPLLIGKSATKITGRVEIVRSFSYKMNAGNYESRDWFASQKVECDAAEAIEVSELVYQFVKKEVMRSVSEYKRGAETQAEVTDRRIAEERSKLELQRKRAQ